MRKIFALLFIVSLGFAYQFKGVEELVGRWVNARASTRGITKVVISLRGGDLYVKVWGKCHPTDCYWGEVKAYTFAGNLYQDPTRSFRAMLAIFKFRESERFLLAERPSAGILKVKLFNHYPLNQRKNSAETYLFRKAKAAPPPPPSVRGITRAPRPLYPPNWKVFNHYPRRTTLRWASVPGAVSYTVEIYYIEPCGPLRRIETCRAVLLKRVEGIRGTSYTFNFVGAQPGKWRVWGVDARGRPGPKSPWMYFRYTR